MSKCRKDSVQERIHVNFKSELDEIRRERLKRDLEVDLIPIRELTRMALNAETWPYLKEELKTKRRKGK